MTDQTPSDDPFDMDDPIARAWADQDQTSSPSLRSTDLAGLADSVARAHRKEQRLLIWLNAQEVLPSVAIAALVSIRASDSARPAATLLAAAIVLAVGCFLAITSIRHHRADRGWGTSVRDQLARRLAQVDHRARLFRNVAWWYLLPCATAIALLRYGAGGDVGTPDLIAAILAVGFLAVLYWFNRRVGRTRYEPEVEQLRALLVDFDRAV